MVVDANGRGVEQEKGRRKRRTAKQVMRTAILLVLAIATAVDMVKGGELLVDEREGGEMWRKGRRKMMGQSGVLCRWRGSSPPT